MFFILVTLETFQLPMGSLKYASINKSSMFVTWETSQSPIGMSTKSSGKSSDQSVPLIYCSTKLRMLALVITVILVCFVI